jgi:CheY-like chemotaxis protein
MDMARLLILDDEPETLSWMSAALAQLCHEVRGFLTGASALRALEEWTPDLIVADILMPEMDGLAFARLARRFRTCPIMFISIAAKQAEAILVGAVGYVPKPAGASEVRAAVERVLGHAARQNVILIVDDDEDTRELYRYFLEPRFSVLEASHGREALDEIRSQHVDLAIVDIHMPVMNGTELIRAIRADPDLQRLPIIVQTSDRTALDAPVWRDLKVSLRVDKRDFLDWLDANIHAHTRDSRV